MSLDRPHSLDLTRIDNEEDIRPRDWTHSRKPATYSEEYVLGRLEPLRGPQPSAWSAGLRSKKNAVHPLAASPVQRPLRAALFEGRPATRSTPGSPIHRPLPPRLRDFSPTVFSRRESPSNSATNTLSTEKSAISFVSSLVKLGTRRKSDNGKRRHDQDQGESSPSNSQHTFTSSIGGPKDTSAGTSTGSPVQDPSMHFNVAEVMQGESTDSSNGQGVGSIGRRQRPDVPRIIIPDGTSINLSTPPTTPRQEYRRELVPPSQLAPWPYSLLQLSDRLQTRSKSPMPNKATITSPTSAFGNWQVRRHQSQPQLQQSSGQEVRIGPLDVDTTALGNSHAQQEHAVLEDTSADQTRHGYLPEFGIMGLPMTFRTDSAASSDRYMWWDYDEPPGGIFSIERWKHLLCSRPGLANTLRHVATTILGLLIILAIALTALGRMKHHSQVSDIIPDSLEDTIMEAQIVVIKDLHGLRDEGMGKEPSGMVEPPAGSLRSGTKFQLAKIPIWTDPIKPGCCHEKCDISGFGSEFYAFMNPEAFGIQLSQNWPSLCNSCIEISRNQFVYKTRVRILGDLMTCSGGSSSSEDSRHQSNPESTSLFTSVSALPTSVPPVTLTPSAPVAPDSVGASTPLVQEAVSTPTSASGILTTSLQRSPPSLTIAARHRRQHRHHDRRPPSSAPPDFKISLSQSAPEPKLLPRQLTPRIAPLQTSPTLGPEAGQDPALSLPLLIVDPATFINLTLFDSLLSLHSMDRLYVQFRFVLCDN